MFGFCFVLPFVLGRIHYFQIFLELQIKKAEVVCTFLLASGVQCLCGQLLTSDLGLISFPPSVVIFSLPHFPLLPSPPLLFPVFPPTHSSIYSIILDTEYHCVDQIGFKLSLFARRLSVVTNVRHHTWFLASLSVP